VVEFSTTVEGPLIVKPVKLIGNEGTVTHASVSVKGDSPAAFSALI
jgi:hypothetical protein